MFDTDGLVDEIRAALGADQQLSELVHLIEITGRGRCAELLDVIRRRRSIRSAVNDDIALLVVERAGPPSGAGIAGYQVPVNYGANLRSRRRSAWA